MVNAHDDPGRTLLDLDDLQVESEVIEIVPSRSRPDRATVTVRSETLNQRDDVVQRTTVKLLVSRRSGNG